MSLYEHHNLSEDYPIIFHIDTLTKGSKEEGISNWHENIELLCCAEGGCDVVVNGEVVRLTEGETAVINSGRIHYTAVGSDYATYYCLIIDSHFLKRFGLNIEGKEFKEYINDRIVKEYMEKIAEEHKNKGAYYENIIKGTVISLVSYLFRKYSSVQKKAVNDDAIKRGIEYIREHLSEEIAVEDVAGYAGFSRFHFSRRFKAVVGCPISEYVRLMRCREAKSMLVTGRYSVSEVADMCGFSDVSYFTKVFKGCFGVLPSELKNGNF